MIQTVMLCTTNLKITVVHVSVIRNLSTIKRCFYYTLKTVLCAK